MTEELHFETLAIHTGQEPDPATGSVVVPIHQTSTYVQEEVGVHKGYEYSRTGNPTRAALEECLAALEGGMGGLAFASGMAAIATVMYLLKPGDHVVAGDDVYGGTYRLFQRVLADYGLEFTYVDLTDLAAARDALRPATKMVWLETPTNPLLKVIDIAGVVELAQDHREASGVKAYVVVDNTFPSPYLQRPLDLGADIVVHSTTKYIGGHSDLLGGAVVTDDAKVYEELKFLQNAVGAVPGPFDCWLALRGLKTLGIRMQAHSDRALTVAHFLANHPAVKRVLYPGLSDHPQHELARRQMRDFGGMVSFEVRGGEAAARELVTRTKIFALAESLGGVESLIELPAPMTHASVQDSPLEVPGGLIRLSVGIEHYADLIEDLDNALEPLVQ